jgi:hypothetical protein
MNISSLEIQNPVEAKYVAQEQRKIIYRLFDSYHSLSFDKKDILLPALVACERLRKYAEDEFDNKAIESEIAELRLALDSLP